MTTLRFDGPGHRLRWRDDLIPLGSTFEVTDGEAASLLRGAPHVLVTLIPTPQERPKPKAHKGEGQPEATPAAEENDDTKKES